MTGGPRFLDEDPRSAPARPDAVPPDDAASRHDLPRGPLLLGPEPDAPRRLDHAWDPENLAQPRTGLGSTVWILAGTVLLAVCLILFACVDLALAMADRSSALGVLAVLAFGVALGFIGYGLAREGRAYRRLAIVDTTRTTLRRRDLPIGTIRATALEWVDLVGTSVPDAAAVRQALEEAATPAVVTAILHHRVAVPLRASSAAIGRQAAIEASTLIAFSPHASWDGLIAGLRGIATIRQVARLYGFRPGPAVTLALLRKVVWTAAGTTAIDLLAQGIADQISDAPGFRQVAKIVPGSSVAALRLLRLAGLTAKACSPIET